MKNSENLDANELLEVPKNKKRETKCFPFFIFVSFSYDTAPDNSAPALNLTTFLAGI